MIPEPNLLELASDSIEIDVLNCAEGDLELKYDPKKPDDVKEAKATIDRMLRSGYALFVHDDEGELQAVTSFDPKKGEYVLKKRRGRPKASVKASGRKNNTVPRSAEG